MSNTLENFKYYAKYGTVPTKDTKDYTQVPENRFYKSVHYVDSVVGPVKDVLFGVQRGFHYDKIGRRNNRSHDLIGLCCFAVTDAILQLAYLAFAYLSYWPKKGLSKLGYSDNPSSLVNYANELQDKAVDHSYKTAKFVSKILSYVASAVIWIVALPIMLIVLAFDKVSSKFSDTQAPEQLNGAAAGQQRP